MNGTTCLEKYHPKDEKTHQGVYIDIFPCDRAAKSTLGRKMQYFASKVVIAKSLYKRGYDTDSSKKKLFMGLCRLLPRKPFLWLTKKGCKDSEFVHSFLGGASSFSKSIYPAECFGEISNGIFEGGIYPIPAKYDELLSILYGDYMMIPPPEERTVKQHAILVDLENSYEKYSDYRDGMEFDTYTRSIR